MAVTAARVGRRGVSMGIAWDRNGWSLGTNVGGLRACASFIFALRECIWNALAGSLVLPAFDDNRWSIPLVPWFYYG